MIEYLHVKNFKCLADVEVTFTPLTILIGPNDSGKSSLLEAIELLGQTTTESWNAQNAINYKTLTWRGTESLPISWRVTGVAGGSQFDYSLSMGQDLQQRSEILKSATGTLFELQPQAGRPGTLTYYAAAGKNPGRVNAQLQHTGLVTFSKMNYGPSMSLSQELRSVAKYRLDPDALRRPAPIHTGNPPRLSSSGDNLVTVLDYIVSSANRKLILGLEETLHKEVPSITGIALSGQAGQNQKSLQFVLAGDDDPPVTISASLASDGLMLLLAFISLSFIDTEDILFVEEPENGIHYSRLKLIVETLRKMSTGEIGKRPRQIIITTHSPVLLNLAKPEEIRVFHRSGSEGTTVKALHELKNADRLLQEFAPGELWYMLGEEALLKEEPA